MEHQSKLMKSSFFSEHLGFITKEFEEGNVVIELPIEDYHLNGISTVHGGVYATMIDNIIGATITSLVKLPSTTINLNIQYLSPTNKGVLTARANILHLGYRIVTGEGIITDETGNVIAKGTGTFKILHPKKKADSDV